MKKPPGQPTSQDKPRRLLKKERHAYILQQVKINDRVFLLELCSEMNVSEDTVRRDLQELADESRLVKVHGGALSLAFREDDTPPDTKSILAKKRAAGKKAATLLRDGMFVLTTGGPMILEMAKAMPLQLKATFISGSIPVVLECLQHPHIEVILIGDKVSRREELTTGAEAIATIRQIRADLCFIEADAIDEANGVSSNSWDIAQLTKAAVESSQKTVCMAIGASLNKSLPIQVCSLQQLGCLVTELSPRDPLLKGYRKAGVSLL